jgi:two-component system, chemotaxis family, protein-glutamate methylesterase/glutaminase
VTRALRVLVADDSATARGLIVSILATDPGLQVVGQAADGEEAVALVKRLRPDIVTMDVHMPRLNGFEATTRLMTEAPLPILIVTAVDPRAVAVSLDAVRAGALAVVAKPSGPASPAFDGDCADLLRAVHAMAGVKVVRRHAAAGASAQPPPARVNLGRRVPVDVVAIAASTGGPAAVYELLRGLPQPFAVPILVVQHMASGFGDGFATWLSGASPFKVKLAADHEPLLAGTVFLGVDERHLGVRPGGGVLLSAAAPVGGFRPSGTFLFESVASHYGERTAAVILTGMGRDGVDGLVAVRRAGGLVIAEHESTAVVYGMPGQAVAAGLCDHVLPLGRIPAALATAALRNGRNA